MEGFSWGISVIRFSVKNCGTFEPKTLLPCRSYITICNVVKKSNFPGTLFHSIGSDFTPKFFTLIKEGISREQIGRDLMSGVIVGIVALPLAIAFAIASGVSPEKGLITAVVAGFLISLLGGSRVQIGGPTGAFIVIVYGIVAEHGIRGLTIATIMAGLIIIGMGLARLGNYLRFIPYPLIVGFTSGIALIIFSSQIKDLFGLDMGQVPADFFEKWAAFSAHIGSASLPAVLIGIGTIVVSLYFHKISRKIPGSIAAILLTTLIAQLLGLPVETIESRFGEIPSGISAPSIPMVSFSELKTLIQPAIAIALLGAIESLLSAVVADGMIGGRHRSNAELIAQGTANIFSGLFGGIPATGAIARTATNIKSGGRTPIAGMVHALVLLLIMLIFAPYAKLIPMATLAGILVVVSWHMAEWKQFRSILKSDRMDVLVLLTTFLLTVAFDLIIAIEVGMILASFIFMKRMGDATQVRDMEAVDAVRVDGDGMLFEEELQELPRDVLLYEINGPLFFGASQKFYEVLESIHQRPRLIIMRMRHVPFIDATGVNRLREVVRQLRRAGTKVLISGANEQVTSALSDAGLLLEMGDNTIHTTIADALTHARDVLAKQPDETA